LRFIGKEVFANVPKGEVRQADVVARLETRDGEPELVLVHVEVQTAPKSDFPRRMFEYYSLLRLHYGLPVFPVALYLRQGPRSRIAEYREALFGQELLLFRYHSLALARLSAEEYVGASPLGAALSALMGRAETGDRARLRLSMIERVVGSKLDEALKYLLVNVIESFFKLSGKDAERYRRLVSRKEYRAVQDVELTWADKLIEKGRKKGQKAGVIEGKREMLLRLLATKFGELPQDMAAKAKRMSAAQLDSVVDRLLTATTLDDLDLTQK